MIQKTLAEWINKQGVFWGCCLLLAGNVEKQFPENAICVLQSSMFMLSPRVNWIAAHVLFNTRVNVGAARASRSGVWLQFLCITFVYYGIYHVWSCHPFLFPWTNTFLLLLWALTNSSSEDLNVRCLLLILNPNYCWDGQYNSILKVKTKLLYHPLVVGCSTGHKLLLSYVQ